MINERCPLMPPSRLLTAASRLRMITAALSDPKDIQVAKTYLNDLENLARCELAIVDVPADTRHDRRRERAAVLSAVLKKSFAVRPEVPFLDLLTDLDAPNDVPTGGKARRLS